jgi:hypothetical protein
MDASSFVDLCRKEDPELHELFLGILAQTPSFSGSESTASNIADYESVTSNASPSQPTADELEGIQDLLADFANTAAAITTNTSAIDWDALVGVAPDLGVGKAADLSSVDIHVSNQEDAFADIPLSACVYLVCLCITCPN